MYGLTLSLYWLVAILAHLMLIDPNPPPPFPPTSSTPKKQADSAQATPPTPHEPFIVRLIVNFTHLPLLHQTILTLPAVHFTLVHYLHTLYPAATPPPLLNLVCPYHRPNPHTHTLSPLTLTGILLVLFSAPLRLLCFHQLGRSFTFNLTRPHNGLVQSGLYKYVRHPSYTTVFLATIGYLLTFASPGGVAMQCFLGTEHQHQGWAKVVVAGLCVALAGVAEFFRERIKGEERFLSDMYGDEWRDYVARTNMLVPWVY